MPAHATILDQPEKILTANGTILAKNSAELQVKTTTGATLKLACLVCPDTDENLISVLDCAKNHDAVIFDDRHAYLVPNSKLNQIHDHLVPIADVQDNEYIIKFSSPPVQNRTKLGRGHRSHSLHNPTLTSAYNPTH